MLKSSNNWNNVAAVHPALGTRKEPAAAGACHDCCWLQHLTASSAQGACSIFPVSQQHCTVAETGCCCCHNWCCIEWCAVLLQAPPHGTSIRPFKECTLAQACLEAVRHGMCSLQLTIANTCTTCQLLAQRRPRCGAFTDEALAELPQLPALPPPAATVGTGRQHPTTTAPALVQRCALAAGWWRRRHGRPPPAGPIEGGPGRATANLQGLQAAGPAAAAIQGGAQAPGLQ